MVNTPNRTITWRLVYWLAFYEDIIIRVLPKSRFVISIVPSEPPGTLLCSKKKWDGSNMSYTEGKKWQVFWKGWGQEKQEGERRVSKKWENWRKKGEKKTYKETFLFSFILRTYCFPITPLPSTSMYRKPQGADSTSERDSLFCSSQVIPSSRDWYPSALLCAPHKILAIWFCRVMTPSCQDHLSFPQFKKRLFPG